MKLKSINP